MDMKISPSSQAADDCTALGCATVARTEAKLLIVCHEGTERRWNPLSAKLHER